MSHVDVFSLLPEMILCAAGVVLLMLEALTPGLRRAFTALAVLSTAVAAWGAWYVWVHLPEPALTFGGLLETSRFTYALSLVVLLATGLCLLASQGYLRRENILSGEYHALLLWCACGLLLMLRATELLTIFVSLELFSLCLYSLAAYHRRLAIATEGALKYFLMGAFVSAFILYGVALVFGATGSTHLAEIGTALGNHPQVPVTVSLGFLMLVAGFGFKMSVVAVLSVLSMLVGNLLALVQRDIKRMLAYSGIAHMGYLLLAFVTLDRASLGPVIVYLLAYVLMNAGAFTVVTLLYNRPGEQHLISNLAGWGYRYPLLGGCLAICMLSLVGIPPTVGFIGKYVVFLNAVGDGLIGLAVLGVLASLIGVFYYLRVVYVLYMQAEEHQPEGLLIDVWGRAAAVLAALGTLVLGIWPSGILQWLIETTATIAR